MNDVEDDDPAEDARRDGALKLVRGHSAQLAEHFDTVQIFVTRHGPDGTVNVTWGDGNWYARYGQVRHWVACEETPSDPSRID